MRNTILILVAICFSFTANAQSNAPINSLNIAVYVPQSDLLNAANSEKLKSKMTQFLTKSGLGSDDEYSASFMMYPITSIVEDFQLDAGAEPQTAVIAEITFIIKQIPESKVFGSAIIKVKGVGKTKDEAFRNSFSAIKATDPVLVEFVKSTRDKIVQHYKDNCDIIITTAQTEFNKKYIEKAIYILDAVPSDAKDCYIKVQEKIKVFYQALVDNECQQMMIQANAASANKEYSEAFNFLGNIAPNSKCYNDAKLAITKIEAKISKEDAEAYKRIQEEKRLQTQKEMAYLSAAKEVAKEYFKSQKRDYHLYIIR
jgi:hypothetical protein